MITVVIYKLDSDKTPVVNLTKGSYTFGRGPLLQCDDRRVSRSHGVIDVTDTSVTIKSIHQNPCFYQTADSTKITILPKAICVDLNDGDKFALLADQFWFKVRLEKADIEDNNNKQLQVQDDIDVPSTNGVQSTKEVSEEEDEDKKTKKTKISDDDVQEEAPVAKKPKKETMSPTQSNVPLSARDAELKAMLFSSDDEEDATTSCKDPAPENPTINNDNAIKEETVQRDNKEMKNESVDDVNETVKDEAANAGTSTDNSKKPRRDYCIYGGQCYRNNNAHFAEFSHPGDSDYESDPKDDRPECSYGASCYRANKDHRKAFKHPRGDQNTKKPVKKPQAAKNAPKKRRDRKNYQDESSEDDYDMDDPFMADSSSEFEIDSVSEDDTDSSGSGGSEEETKRLIKEAKRFTKGKKKGKDT